MSSCVALSPNSIWTGSPGAMYIREKTISVTPSSTGIIRSSRFNTYRYTLSPHFWRMPKGYAKVTLLKE